MVTITFGGLLETVDVHMCFILEELQEDLWKLISLRYLLLPSHLFKMPNKNIHLIICNMEKVRSVMHICQERNIRYDENDYSSSNELEEE
ncbi:hypothetical protein Sjap_018184 [Stephania japonica]|uniref:Uncharacterized protein n=1 Tax=Stephania japonica TaxID=461633 RepID=A0AAP0NKU8_9MAGN